MSFNSTLKNLIHVVLVKLITENKCKLLGVDICVTLRDCELPGQMRCQ